MSIHEWDAAYVLGALSPEDRRLFEAHLEECPECRASVAELAGMPALLAQVPAPELGAAPQDESSGDPFETRASSARPAPHGSGGLPVLARRVRRRRLTRRWTIAAASVLAAAAIAAAVVLPATLSSPPGTGVGTQIALAQTTPSPLSASVSLTAKRWGTAVSMTCRYDAPSSPYANGSTGTTRGYALYVTDASGQATRVASWSAWPGAEIHAAGSVDLQKSQLRTVQLRDAATDAVLLSSPVH